MYIIKAIALGALLITTASAQSGSPLDVRMELTPATILLGEPAWVDVTVVNRSAGPLLVDMGNSCFGAKELIVQVPEAEPQIHDRKHCGVGMAAGSCMVELAVKIDAGATFKRRYVLSGDFRITRSGSYTVLLEKNFPYGPDAGELSDSGPRRNPHLTENQMVRIQQTLNVLPADHNKLLQIEQAEAQELAAPLPTLPFPPNAGIDLVRQISDDRRKLQQDASTAKYAMASGLIEYPTYGMEPIFSSWLDQNNTTAADWALSALSHLNTPASRKILARQAASPDKPQDTSFQTHRWEAVEYLSNMGDKSYVPLLERLTRDRYHDVQRLSVRGLGLLGGEKELPFLNAIALNAKTMSDRQDAVMAMGDTGSLRAIPLLIELYTLPGSDESTSEFALWTLTHHHVQLPYATRMLTPQEAKVAWQNWWLQNQRTARVYGPYDCADIKEGLVLRLGRLMAPAQDDTIVRRLIAPAQNDTAPPRYVRLRRTTRGPSTSSG
jgi:HEAT repeat protein